MKCISLQGAKLAGGNPKDERVEYDFYATDPKAVEKLLLKYSINGNKILEPCVGNGNIADTVKKFYKNETDITGVDIVDRGYPNTIVQDFLTWKTDEKFEVIITNPPYKYAKEFVQHALDISKEGTKVAMFLKVTFLEGKARKELFKKYPPKTIYVFSSRVKCAKNGDFEIIGSSAVAYAWFVWVKGYNGDSIVKWVN